MQLVLAHIRPKKSAVNKIEMAATKSRHTDGSLANWLSVFEPNIIHKSFVVPARKDRETFAVSNQGSWFTLSRTSFTIKAARSSAHT